MEELKKVIQSANPEIMELKFGCVVKKINSNSPRIIVGVGEKFLYLKHGNGATSYRKEDVLIVIGRPITLADVLISTNNSLYDVSLIKGNNDCLLIGHRDLELSKFVKWNLKETLEGQSPECIDFLKKLLVK